MAKTYSYNLRLEQEDVRTLEAWQAEGLSRSAVLRMAINDIPLQKVVERMAGMKVPPNSSGEPMTKIAFSIHPDQRAKLDALIDASVATSFVVRHSFRRYLERSIEELKRIKGTMRAYGRQRAEVEKQKLAAKLTRNGRELDPMGAGRNPKQVAAPPIPIRTPKIDWSRVGPVTPRSKASEEAEEQAQEAAQLLPPPPEPERPRASRTAVSEALDGITFEEAGEREKAAKTSPLDALRALRGQK